MCIRDRPNRILHVDYSSILVVHIKNYKKYFEVLMCTTEKVRRKFKVREGDKIERGIDGKTSIVE